MYKGYRGSLIDQRVFKHGGFPARRHLKGTEFFGNTLDAQRSRANTLALVHQVVTVCQWTSGYWWRSDPKR